MSIILRRFAKLAFSAAAVFGVAAWQALPEEANADPSKCDQLIAKLLDSVVMLQGESQAGTGFVLNDGSIITNAHVIEGICESGTCRNLQVFTANKIGQHATTLVRTGQIVAEVNAKLLDLAILRPRRPFPNAATKGIEFGEATKVGDTICTIGFPQAERLRMEGGQVQYDDRIRITTTARGLHGVSGSPIVNDQGQLVGIVNESSTLAGGWAGLLLDLPFELSGVQASVLKQLQTSRNAEMLLIQAKIMNEHFADRISRWAKQDTPRFVDTVWEANQMEAFAEDLKRYRVRIGSLAPLNSYAGEPFLLVNTLIEKYPSLDTELDLEAEKLFLTYTVGLDPLLTSWKARLLSKRVTQMPRPEAHKTALRALLLGESSTPGAQSPAQ